MGSSLLMTDQHVTQPPLAFRHMKSVIDREDGSAWIAEDRVDSMAAQSVHQGTGTGHTAPIPLSGRCIDLGSGGQRHSGITTYCSSTLRFNLLSCPALSRPVATIRKARGHATVRDH